MDMNKIDKYLGEENGKDDAKKELSDKFRSLQKDISTSLSAKRVLSKQDRNKISGYLRDSINLINKV